jgi:hypothetical protein
MTYILMQKISGLPDLEFSPFAALERGGVCQGLVEMTLTVNGI